MQEEINRYRFEGKIKAQILKQIFKDLSPKNLKGVDHFYLILKKEEMEMQFASNAKDILITIILKSNLFQSYKYNRESFDLHKYSLDDFSALSYLFENNKIILDLFITNQMMRIRSNTGKGFAEYGVVAMSCDQDDEDFLIEDQELRPNVESSMTLKLARVGLFEGILSYCKGNKIPSLWFRFESCKKMLEISDADENHEIKWYLRVDEQSLHNLDSHMQFDSKTLSCAMSLLPNDSELQIKFYPDFMLLDVPEKEKIFTIKLNAKGSA